MTKNIVERNKLVEENLDFADNIARRYSRKVHSVVQFGELQSAAYEGLIDAADKYNPKLAHQKAQRPFQAYARIRVIGAIQDFLRACSWGSRSRYIQMQSLEQRRNGDEHQSGSYTIKSLLAEDDSNKGHEQLISLDAFNKLIRPLSKRDKQVFALRYVHNMSMNDIGEKIGITESRVSQILSSGIRLLVSVWGERKEQLL